jgi:serine O-acetyltransferase
MASVSGPLAARGFVAMKFQQLNRLAEAFKHNLDGSIIDDEVHPSTLPSRVVIEKICNCYLKTLFALFHYGSNGEERFLGERVGFYLGEIRALLLKQTCHAVHLQAFTRDKPVDEGMEESIKERIEAVFEQLPEVARLLGSDVDAAFANDPAAAGYEEVLLAYPCIEAITLQRLAHRLYLSGIPIIPRMMTETAHSHTGIDIHPGAAIGESFFIDHGTGVVIGETATIGNKVTLYHGVTLGAFNPLVKDEQARLRRGHENKRHPDLEDHVTVYPNATILGGGTRVGHHSTIGGNVWLTHSVPPYSKVIQKDPGVFVHSKRMKSLPIAENI